jgi:two-component system cell cycle sensor histidine kinase/response regulator CckA
VTALDQRAIRDLTRQLSEAQATINALLSGQIDAVVDPGSMTPLLLSEAQAALRESEGRYRHERDRAQRYLDTAEVILLALDLDGRVTLINRKGCELLGWTESQLVGRPWIETCLPARGREALAGRHDDLMSGAMPEHVNAVLTRSGEERLIEWHNTVLRDDGGRVIGSFSSGNDITRRHEATDALRIAEERMRFALEAARVGIWDMDYTTGVLRWSAILESQYGINPGTFNGTLAAFLTHVHPQDRDAVRQTMETAKRSGSDFSLDHRAMWPDGTIRWLSGGGRVHLDRNGEAMRAIGITIDVTDRHVLEQQYQQAQKMEAVGRLAGGVAHDFNNLLTVILGYSEILLADINPADPRKADITAIQAAGRSAAGLTRQLLAFSRKQIIDPVVLDLNLVVANMKAMVGRLIGEDVRVVLVLAQADTFINADRGQIEQVLMNLAVNARDAMPGGGTLTITTANVVLNAHGAAAHLCPKPGPYVVLTVTDTGTGLTPEAQARLFEPFFTTKEPGKGTGLGLATVHGIVLRSGGSVAVSSEPGRGASFIVYLPRAEGPALVDEAPPVSPPRVAAQTVLVVDDEEGLRTLARRFLERQGYTVLLAASAEEALRLFGQHARIDVLLTDVIMPGASGAELTKQLVQKCPALKVVYMSGYTEDAIARHGVLNPGIAFLHKPFTSDTLGAKIREAVAGS